MTTKILDKKKPQKQVKKKPKQLPKKDTKKSKNENKKAKSTPTQARNWAFTDFQNLDFSKIYEEYSDIIRYMCVGKETCPKTKKTHNQGWIQFNNKKRMGGVKKIFGCNKIHLESCRGSPDANDNYCQKENNYQTFGKCLKQGQRSDLEHIQYLIKEKNYTKEQIMETNFSLYCRYKNGIDAYHALCQQKNSKKFRKVAVEYIYGTTGTGKTRYAMEQDDVYKIEGSCLQWFDGYSGEKTLLIDEYNNDEKITKLLNITDGYQLRLPIKGGFTYANWNRVIITSNLCPEQLHENARSVHRDALFRRITKIVEKFKDKEIIHKGIKK